MNLRNAIPFLALLMLTAVTGLSALVANATSGSSEGHPPIVISLSPMSVSAGGGSPVTITGVDLTDATAVEFGANASSAFKVESSKTIVAIAPVGAGTVPVHVVTPGGTSPAALPELTYESTGQPPITASGQSLEVNGTVTHFTGVNAYELATDQGTNAGCGSGYSESDINDLFTALAPHSIVRFDVFQGAFGTNVQTHQVSWGPIDRIFYLAAKDHVYLLPVITDQGAVCDGGHWQDPSWYQGGYRDVFDSGSDSDGTGDDQLSYWDYLQLVVHRYRDSPALAMWEPISEAEASTCPSDDEPSHCSGNQTCPSQSSAAAALRSFFDVVGQEIHHIDPRHLVEGGFLGGGQCGTGGADYAAVGASPGIDVLSVHDYYGSAPLGGDQYNGLGVRFGQAASLDKPIITGESGIEAGINQSGCESLLQRASDDEVKELDQFAAGSSAFLVWNWSLAALGPCSYNTGPEDPLMEQLDSS